MMLRSSLSRQGRRALALNGRRPWYRTYATEIDTQANDAAFEAALNQEAGAAASRGVGADSTDASSTSLAQPRRRTKKKSSIVDSYLAHKHMQSTTANFGSKNTRLYQPHKLLSNPPRPSDVTLELLLASQAHMGHSTSLWNPANSRYIFGVRQGIHIISLDATAAHLRRAAKVVSGVTERAGLILFVGTRPGFDRCVVRAAELAGGCHLFERWTPGTITNGQQILGKCQTKVVDQYDVEQDGFEGQLLNRAVLRPDLVVCLNPLECKVMLHECALANIPTIGVIDTDANPTWVTYPIPANDDSLRTIQVIAGVLGRAGEEGINKRMEAASMGELTYQPVEDLTLPEGWEEANPDEPVLDIDEGDEENEDEDEEDEDEEDEEDDEVDDDTKRLSSRLSPQELEELAASPVSDDEIDFDTEVNSNNQAYESQRSIAHAVSNRQNAEVAATGPAPATYDMPLSDAEYSDMIAKLTDEEMEDLERGSMSTAAFQALSSRLNEAELNALREDYAPADEVLGEANTMGYNAEPGDNAIDQELVEEGKTEGAGLGPKSNRVSGGRGRETYDESSVAGQRGGKGHPSK